MIECRVCKINKEKNDFRHNIRKCKSCEREYGRIYNKTKSHIRKKWVEDNKDRMIFLQSRWHQNNKPRLNEKYNQRYKTDIEFKLKKNLSRMLTMKIVKNNSTSVYLDTSITKIREWLDSIFDENMNWDNYGSYWDIDHVIPISLFDLNNPEDIAICFNWRNLRPYPKILNIKKSNFLYPLSIILQELQVRFFSRDSHTLVYFNHYSQKFSQLLKQHIQNAGTPLEF